MSERWIEIVVSPEGDVTMEAHGYHGQGCDAAIQRLTPPGAEVTGSRRKPEYHQAATVSTGKRERRHCGR